MTLNLNTKIGYLNLRTGKYKYVPIIEIQKDVVVCNEKIKTGRFSFVDNTYRESIAKLIEYAATPSIDFKDGRPLIKLKN